eukprot:170653_1
MKIAASLGFGYVIKRGIPLIKRPIHSDRKDVSVNDTKGPPTIDTEWSYESRTRDPSTDALELSSVPVRPITSDKTTVLPQQTHFDVLIIGGAAAGLSVAACCEKEGLSYLV